MVGASVGSRSSPALDLPVCYLLAYTAEYEGNICASVYPIEHIQNYMDGFYVYQ